MDKIQKQTLQERIISPCMELIEKIERSHNNTINLTEKLHRYEADLHCSLNAKKLILPRIVIIVGTKCTLRCKDCSNLIQYYTKPANIEIHKLLKDLEHFFTLVDHCIEVSVIGGEPFIYPQLDQLLSYLNQNKSIDSIEIITNATVLPHENLLLEMANPKTKVILSDYGNIDIIARLCMLLDKYNIRSDCLSSEKWIDCGDCTSRNRTSLQLETIYKACGSSKFCKTLFNGKLFDCPRAAHLMNLGFADNIDYLDIYNSDQKNILDFFTKNFATACDYCDFFGPDRIYVEPAIQMNNKHFERSNYTLISRKNYDELIEAKEYWQQNYKNSEKTVMELQRWTKELEDAKAYFLNQITALEMQNNELKEQMKKNN